MRDLLFGFLNGYVQNQAVETARWRHFTGKPAMQGVPPSHHDTSATLFLRRCVLTVHCAQPENWFLRLFEMTGSSQHVATIMERVRGLPGTWEPGESIRVRNKRIVPASEGHVYDALNMSLVPPWKRI